MAKNLLSGSGAVSGCEKIAWGGSGRSRSGSHRNRFERRVEILPLALHSHALMLRIDHSRDQV